MITDELKNQILAHIGPTKQTAKGWMTRNCMVCHHYGETADTRGRFGLIFDSDTISTHCFNCGHKSKFVTGGTLSKDFCTFLGGIGIPEDTVKHLSFEAYKSSTNISHDYVEIKNSLPSAKWKAMDLPDNSLSISEWAKLDCIDKNFIDVVNYALSRGLNCFDDLYWSPDEKSQMNKRLIVPFTYHGHNYGYVARYAGEPPNKYIPKYRGHSVNDFVFRLDRRHHYCIITEGTIDAMLVNGISTLGKEITDGQQKLIAHHRDNIIVLPDFDRGGQKMIDSALKYGWSVSFPFWHREFKDAASASLHYGRVAVTQSIIEQVETDPLSIEVKWRLALSERN